MRRYSYTLLTVPFYTLVGITLVAISSILSGAQNPGDIPLEIHTKEHNIKKVRKAVKGGFKDIVGAPTEEEQFDYLKVRLMPNGFITTEEYICIVTFKETLEGLRIKAVPYDVENGKRREVKKLPTRKGVFMIIEGAAQELNYGIEMGNPKGNTKNSSRKFNSFNEEIKSLDGLLEEGRPYTISIARYPRQGRVYRKLTPDKTGLVQLVEHPRQHNKTLRLWVVQTLPGNGSGRGADRNTKIVGEWLESIGEKYMDDDDLLPERFFKNSQANFQKAPWQVVIQSEKDKQERTNRSLMLQ